MVTLSQVGQGREDTLNVHNHGFNGTGNNRELLLIKIPGNFNAVTHRDFIAGTANADQVDSLCTDTPGKSF